MHIYGHNSGGQINAPSIDITDATLNGTETETNAWFSRGRPKSQVDSEGRTETEISTFSFKPTHTLHRFLPLPPYGFNKERLRTQKVNELRSVH